MGVKTAANKQGMSDPNYKPDEPAAPVESNLAPHDVLSGMEGKTQEELDEEYARLLQREYEAESRRQRRSERAPPTDAGQERSWYEDELPKIRDQIGRGFNDTRSAVSSFVTRLRAQWEGDDVASPTTGTYDSPRVSAEQREYLHSRWQSQWSQPERQRAQRDGGGPGAAAGANRRSGDVFDSDPRELGDDFSRQLQLQDDEAPGTLDVSEGPPRPVRPEKKQDIPRRTSASRWEPIPISSARGGAGETGNADDDPFDLGDDDDDDDDELNRGGSAAALKGQGAPSNKETKEQSLTEQEPIALKE